MVDKKRATQNKKNEVIAHLDMDSYFASVEQQLDPFLQGRPVVVAGKPGSRTVVAAASKEAKLFGIRSGMPSWEASKICPDLIIAPGHPKRYQDIHRQVLKIINQYTPLVEVFSIDEWFMDISNTVERFGGVEEVAKSIKDEIRSTFGDVLTCSIGVASNRTVAKVASDLDKPNGLVWARSLEEEQQILQSVPLTDLCGIGWRLEKRLSRLGIFTVEQLLDCPESVLVREFGPNNGRSLQSLAWGGGGPLQPFYSRPQEKSIQRGTTLPFNTLDEGYIESILMRLVQRVTKALRKSGLFTRRVGVWVRNQEFQHAFSMRRMVRSVRSEQVLSTIAQDLFAELEFTGQVRALGVYATELFSNRQLTLWDWASGQRDGIWDWIYQQGKEKEIFPGTFLKSSIEKKVAGYYPRLQYGESE